MDIYDNLHDVISRAIWDAFKPGTEPPDAEALRKAVRGQLRLYLHMSLYPHYEKLIGVIDEDAFTDSLVKEFWEKRAVKQTDGNYLFSSEGNEPWLDDAERNGEITWHYWGQYRKYLDEDLQWPRSVCDVIGRDTREILALTHDPKDIQYSTKGLVIGNVQSGKTANYLGLLCRAADAGYKYLVILASTTNDLREQTQKRIEEGFIGFRLVQDQEGRRAYRKENVGVGDGVVGDFRHPNPGTTRDDDFKKAKMQAFLNISAKNVTEPWIFIIKKNTSTLRNLITWFRQQERGPNDRLFLIDDEADYASINTQYSKDKISTINRLIRDLYLLFPCRTYVSYTATPYANILIDCDAEDEAHGEDLFPKDFIYTLNPSDSYFGADEIFADLDDAEDGEGRCKYLRFIDDCVPPSKKDTPIEALPETLKDAIRTFMLASAIWSLRLDGRPQNMTMLVNVSQFISIQGKYRRLIDYFLEDIIVPAFRIYGTLPTQIAEDNSQEIQMFRRVWNLEYDGKCEFSWEKVFSNLFGVALRIKTALIHGKSKENLGYDSGNECVIAIGGNRLSRGLTLDGLVVSYFNRNSRAYDTLMQMSRWFGHRTGYQDICRIWMTAESAGWCRFIADSTNDLIVDLIRMQRRGATPREFGLKIRAHPDTLMVTARNKMGAGELKRNIQYDGKYVETFALLRADDAIEANFTAADKLMRALEDGGYEHHRYEDEDGYLGELVSQVPARLVEDFVSEFVNNDADSKCTVSDSVLTHIEYCKDEGALYWDVLLAASDGAQTDEMFWFDGQKLCYERRSPGVKIDDYRLIIGNRNKVSTKHPERAGLDPNMLQTIKDEYEQGKSTTPHPSFDYLCRKYRKRPLLVIHHLDVKFASQAAYERACQKGDAKHGKLDGSHWHASEHKPVVAWSISFPILDIEKEVEYVFNKVALNNMYIGEDGHDDDLTSEEEED